MLKLRQYAIFDSLRKADFRVIRVELCTCLMMLVSEHFLRTLATLENNNRFSMRNKECLVG